MDSGNSVTTTTTASALRKSCQHCRKRKIKCLQNDMSAASGCRACVAKNQECVFEAQATMGRPPKSKTTLQSSAASSSSNSSNSGDVAGLARSSTTTKKRAATPTTSSKTTTSSSTSPAKKVKLDTQHAFQQYPAISHGYIEHQPSSIATNCSEPMNTTAIATARSDLPYLLNGPTTNTINDYNPQTYFSQSLPFQNIAIPTLLQSQPEPSVASTSSHIAKALWVQTEADPFPSFRKDSIHSLASAFHEILSSSVSHSSPASTPILSDPRIPPMARIRTLAARATATRKAIDRGPSAATPNYARSLISPLWDGLPVDIIALTTTGKPSASGPFSIASEASKRNPPSSGPSAAHDEYLYIKLLREDESCTFQSSSQYPSPKSSSSQSPSSSFSHNGQVFPQDSPGYRYAPDKTTIGKFFTGYFSKHPLAPLILNERLFLEDLMSNRIDSLLLHVIVGSSIARAPCLGAGNDDGEEVGDEFFRYVEQELLARQLEGACDMQTCQSLMLWATHELTHMRVRRANALFSTAEVILRQRLLIFQRRVEEEAAYTRLQSEGRDMSGQSSPTPLGWRDLVEQELAVNALWIVVIWNTWTSLSLKLPHNTTSIMASSLPAPPQSIQTSSSFAFAYSTPDVASLLQPIVRRTIERFSDMTQLINIIVTLKNQSQAKNLFAPDPPRPLAVIDDEEAQIATWLVDLAKYYNKSPDAQQDVAINRFSNGQQQLVSQNKLTDTSRSFLVASHAVLALHQILPYATTASNSYGSPLPLPTVDSLKTALTALHLVARSIQVAAPGTRTRTQAILLDAMPRVLSLLDVFTSSSLSSLDHFVLVTSQRQIVHELLDDLNRAIACMSSPGAGTPSLDSCGSALAKSSKSLRTVVDIGMELQQRQEDQTSISYPSQAQYSSAQSQQTQALLNQNNQAAPGTPSTPSTSTDSASSHGAFQDYGVSVTNSYSGVNDAYNSGLMANGYSGQSQPLGIVHHPSTAFFGAGSTNGQFARPDHFSMSSHLANSPLFRNHDRAVTTSPSYIGSLHAYL